jgi:hypothetical protein
MELRTLNFSESKTFECDGRKFALAESISFARFMELQKLILEFGFSADFQDMFKNLRILYDNLNSLKFADSAVIVHNMMYGIIKLDDKEDSALKIASLFINEEGEDVTVYDVAKTKDKINCWSKELDVTPFYNLAVSLVPAWTTAFKHVSQNILPVVEKES